MTIDLVQLLQWSRFPLEARGTGAANPARILKWCGRAESTPGCSDEGRSRAPPLHLSKTRGRRSQPILALLSAWLCERVRETDRMRESYTDGLQGPGWFGKSRWKQEIRRSFVCLAEQRPSCTVSRQEEAA
ncbi:hypothetical protein AOLI_G00283610 [Acnodon oligacanthus]